MLNFFVLTCLMVTTCCGANTVYPTDENRLSRHLVANYRRIGTLGRPVAKDSDPWNVTFHIQLTNIVDVDTESDTIEAITWPIMHWNDVYLNWRKSDYNVDNVRVQPYDVMVPDVFLYNAVSPAEILGPAQVLVYPGGCLYIPPVKQRFSCPISGDEFTCDLKYGSWTFPEDKLNLTLSMDHVDLSYYQPNKNWKIVKTTATRNLKHYPCCSEAYVDVTFSITFKKQ